MRTAIITCTLLLATPISLSAQREDSLGVLVEHTKAADTGTLFFGGMIGMVTGAFGGGFIGSQIDNDSGLDDADGVVIGALVGTTLLIPTTVHLANNNRGNLNRAIVVSTLLGGAIFGLGVATERAELILAIPFVQLFASISIEKDTTSRVTR